MGVREYFTQDDGEQRVLLDSDDTTTGGALLYLPHGKDVTLAPVAPYTMEDMRHPFSRYMFDVLGAPSSIRIAGRDETLSPSPHILATQYTGKVEDWARQVGRTDAIRAADAFDNKGSFQRIVTDVLGPEYSTQPEYMPAGMPVGALSAWVSARLADGRVVVRIPDTKIAPGAGMGVLFVDSTDQLLPFLERNKIVEDGAVTAELLVERFVPNIYSPSITYAIGEDGIGDPMVNAQILEGSRFIGGTNVLPREVQDAVPAMREQGAKLAEYARAMGYRDFIGFDTVTTPGRTPVFVECNARETGTTIPRTFARRMVGFDRDKERTMRWIYLINAEFGEGNPLARDLDTLVARLADKGHLFDHRVSARVEDRPKVGVHFAMEGTYDLVMAWDGEAVSDDEGFDRVNEVLADVGLERRVELPRING